MRLEVEQEGGELNATDIFGNTPLLNAVEDRDLSAVQRLLAAKANSNLAQRHSGLTPLMAAVRQGHMKIILLLLAAGARVAQSDFKGFRPLHTAAYSGHAFIAALLIQSKSDVNALSNHPGSPLYLAVQQEHHAVVRLLLHHKADVNARMLEGASVLRKSAVDNSCGVMRILFDFGADPDQLDDAQMTPLHNAAVRGNNHAIQVLLDRKANVNFISPQRGVTALWLAASCGKDEALLLLLQAKAGVGASNVEGASPLIMAAEGGHRHIAGRLLLWRANVNQRTGNGVSSLHLASQNGHKSTVLCLMRAKAELDAVVFDSGFSPLHSAASNGHTGIVRQLVLANRAMLNRLSKGGDTPLMLAAYRGEDLVVAQLMNLGARADIGFRRNGIIETALYCAVDGGHDCAVGALLEHQPLPSIRGVWLYSELLALLQQLENIPRLKQEELQHLSANARVEVDPDMMDQVMRWSRLVERAEQSVRARLDEIEARHIRIVQGRGHTRVEIDEANGVVMLPPFARCPITRSLWRSGVEVNGFVFERSALTQWLNEGNRRCRATGRPIDFHVLENGCSQWVRAIHRDVCEAVDGFQRRQRAARMMQTVWRARPPRLPDAAGDHLDDAPAVAPANCCVIS